MTAAEALAFVKQRGVVLVSAKGPVPSLTEGNAGEPINGSWWGHPRVIRSGPSWKASRSLKMFLFVAWLKAR